MSADALEHEQQRQQLLLRTLWRRAEDEALGAWLRPLNPGLHAQRGLDAYRANAGASIERALAAGFPTVCALVGEESFAALARAHWHAHPPQRGDLAYAGEQLPEFIAASESLADVPYLADVARLDAAIEAAERAADAAWQGDTLALLGSHDPAQLFVELKPGTCVLSSPYPIVTIRDAHRAEGEDPFAAAREALAAGRGEHALVWRAGLRAQAQAIDEADAQWTRALLQGHSLAQALEQASPSFDFQRWLVAALQHGWLARIALTQHP
jgi:putative DNA-binding protein